MKFDFLANHEKFVPVIAKWYFEEWGHRTPGNSIDKTCERVRQKLNTKCVFNVYLL